MWAQLAATAIGVWLYVAPGVLGSDGAAATSDRIAGALVITFSFIAVWEFMRGLRLANRPIGLWLLVSGWLLGAPLDAALSATLSGAAILALSLVEGKVEGRYGGGWSALTGED